MYGLYGFLKKKLYGLYGFFFENCTDCTDFFWKCTDLLKKSFCHPVNRKKYFLMYYIQIGNPSWYIF